MGSREPVVVDVLGLVRVRIGGREAAIPPGRQRVLLAVLALSAGRAVGVERLTDVLWDADELPENARRTVQTYVTRLRQVLGADAITNESGGYVLRTVPDNVDALRFQQLVARAGREPDVERELLVEALRLWRGDPFEGLDADRLSETEGRRLAEQRLTAIERRIDLDLAGGRAHDVVAELRGLTAQNPLRESLWARLLVTLARTGRQAESLEQYEVVRARIADQLGADPGAELRRIYADLLDGAPESAVVAAATESTPSVPRQLPAEIAGFRGRARELAMLDDTLLGEPEAVRVVAVDGIGGVGKTALALHWAHRRLDNFADGQLYLDLRGYGPREPVTAPAALDHLLRGLGVDGKEIPVEAETRGGLYRSLLARRRMLVILDNARDVEQVRPLLPGAGDSRVVVTSRSQLRGLVARDGARRIDLDRLGSDEAIELLAASLNSRLVAHTTDELVELAERCAHLPLALAIAAERASRDLATGLAELMAELREEGERLDALDAGDESADLRAIFSWSYQRLEPDNARLFRLLGLHPGHDFGLAAAVTLTGLPRARVRRIVDGLVAASLLQQRGPERFEVHDLVRTYAGELAARSGNPREPAEALDRLFDWYLASAMNAAVAMGPSRVFQDLDPVEPRSIGLTFASRVEAEAWFLTERRVLLTAIVAASDQGRDRHVYVLCRALATYLQSRRAFDDLDASVRVARASAHRIGDAAEGHVEILRGRVAAGWSQLELAAGHYRRAITLFEQGDARSGIGSACNQLAMVLDQLGRFDEARTQYQRSVAAHRELEDHHRAGLALNNLAMSYLRASRYDDAASTAQQILTIARDTDDRRLAAYAHDTWGQARLALGSVDAAIGSLRRSRDELHDLGLRYLQGVAALNLGRAYLQAGQSQAALASLHEAETILDELRSPDSAEYSRSQIAELRAMAGLDT